MVSNKESGSIAAISTATLLFLFTRLADASQQRLQQGFYNPTCPQVEEVVSRAVATHYEFDPTIAAGILRLYFHDCFIRGCDASILLDETPSGEPVEKSSPANGKSLRGVEVIDAAKNVLESECPGTVSCADILAFAARDAAVLAGISNYNVPAGRRDGRVSLASDVFDNLPFPIPSVEAITAKFARKGLSQREMVVLSGAHSIGGAHCSLFTNRLYNFTVVEQQDPSLDPFFAGYLKLNCPAPGSFLAELMEQAKVSFNPASALFLDGSYYRGLERGRALLNSDQALMTTMKTRKVVRRMARHPRQWIHEFAKAMKKLGSVDVLVGDEGEVRQSCRFVN